MIEIDVLDDMSHLPMDEETRKKVVDWFRSFLKDIEPPSKLLIFGTKWQPNDIWMKYHSLRGNTND